MFFKYSEISRLYIGRLFSSWYPLLNVNFAQLSESNILNSILVLYVIVGETNTSVRCSEVFAHWNRFRYTSPHSRRRVSISFFYITNPSLRLSNGGVRILSRLESIQLSNRLWWLRLRLICSPPWRRAVKSARALELVMKRCDTY